jgi:NitT/TauT family transport system ATP-binding protein
MNQESSPTGAASSPAAQQVIGIGVKVESPGLPAAKVNPNVVEFRSVTKTYNAGKPNASTAIHDVNFVVEDLPDKGEFICILGPSGCGKSTILRLIAGLPPQYPATAGEVLVLNQPVIGPGADRGMVFQDYTSFDHRTVLENVTFGLECQGVSRRERFELGRQWITQVGLDVELDQDKYPHELSGGMRQRVAIARTLILRPRIILMDEPFGALDPITRMNMQDTLVKLWREVQATVFFVTHSIEEAVFLGDRVYVLSRSPGTLLEELKVEPADRPARVMQSEPRFQQTVSYLRDMISRLEEESPKGAKNRKIQEDKNRKPAQPGKSWVC